MQNFLHNHGIALASIAVVFGMLSQSLVNEAKTELGNNFSYSSGLLSKHFASKLLNSPDCHQFFVNTELKQESAEHSPNKELLAGCQQSNSPFASPRGYL